MYCRARTGVPGVPGGAVAHARGAAGADGLRDQRIDFGGAELCRQELLQHGELGLLLGDKIGALTTLRGELYGLEEAERLGFFHEVVEPDQLLSTAIRYARCITPDCNVAYAMSKKALQDATNKQIDERTVALDALLPIGMSDPGNRQAQDRRRQEIMHKQK